MSNISIAIFEKLPFLKGNKNYFAFDGSNNIFAECRSTQILKTRVIFKALTLFHVIPWANLLLDEIKFEIKVTNVTMPDFWLENRLFVEFK